MPPVSTRPVFAIQPLKVTQYDRMLTLCRIQSAIPQDREGATLRAAGLTVVTASRLHRNVVGLQEQGDGILTDAKAGQQPGEVESTRCERKTRSQGGPGAVSVEE